MIDWLAANWVEIFGFGTGGLCVLLAARRSIWTFPVGLLNNAVFIVLFTGAALYAGAGLQLVYIALGVAGWIGWSRGRADDRRAATLSAPRSAYPVLLCAAVVMTTLLWWLLAAFTDSTTPVADAATTAVSLVAQYMLNRRWIQTWLVWIAVDIAFIGLYASKGLWITAALYGLFIVMCVIGLRTWLRAPHVTASDAGVRT